MILSIATYVTRFVIHSEVRIEGLETLDYLDNLCQRERFTEQGDAITFESEVCILLFKYDMLNKYIKVMM